MASKSQQRRYAIGAARVEMSRTGKVSRDPNDALAVLDDLLRQDPGLEASIWYANATDNQIKLFRREWSDLWYQFA